MSDFVSTLPMTEIANFCQRWQIQELALFGSVLRDDFNPNSDVDVLVTFTSDADWGLLDHAKMQQELQALLHRNVDLITKRAIERSPNWLRRNEILKTAQIFFPERKAIYAAG
jgi:predicted nucleotidyltransferase